MARGTRTRAARKSATSQNASANNTSRPKRAQDEAGGAITKLRRSRESGGVRRGEEEERKNKRFDTEDTEITEDAEKRGAKDGRDDG